MKTERNILIAFILNIVFSIFEFAGGVFTGSVAILSDAVHDLGDATSVGISYFMEKKSKKQPDTEYTYGYVRYSVLGGLITTLILLIGSAVVIYGAVVRLFNPVEINYSGMILFAVVGVIVNFVAAWFTHEGDSINQKAVNLHMLEDVLGWALVLVGGIVMHFTDLAVIDPILSICVAVFILANAAGNLKDILFLFLEKTPNGIDIGEIKTHISEIDGVKGVHHIHIRSIDGQRNYATMHVVATGDVAEIKGKIREELAEHGICHSTLEIEGENEICCQECCHIEEMAYHGHHHHHHS